jgi:SAM-dependent MidA family methyltransferase
MQINHLPLSEDEFTMLVAHEFFDALPINIIEAQLLFFTRHSIFNPQL